MTLVKRGMNVFRRTFHMHLLIVPKSSFVHNMPMSATATQSLRLIVIPTLLSCCLPANMPNQMMMTLKGVAESMIALMTMLLQILISQLEVSNSSEMLEESNEANPEMRQTLENMVQELQNHRNILQGLMANQQALQNQVARPTSGQASGSNSTPAPGGSGVSRGQGTRHPRPLPNVNLQALALQPMGLPVSPTGTVTNSTWILAEEEELRGAHQCDECPTTSTATTPGTTAPRPMSITELGQKVITWGRKHKDKTWLEDIGYYHWSLARYGSLPPDQQEFVRFCQTRIDLEAHRNGP